MYIPITEEEGGDPRRTPTIPDRLILDSQPPAHRGSALTGGREADPGIPPPMSSTVETALRARVFARAAGSGASMEARPGIV